MVIKDEQGPWLMFPKAKIQKNWSIWNNKWFDGETKYSDKLDLVKDLKNVEKVTRNVVLIWQNTFEYNSPFTECVQPI